MIGRSLQVLGRYDDAIAHWRLILELQPSNPFAEKRLKEVQHLAATKKRQIKSAATEFVRRPPAEIVEPNLSAAGRDACLRFLAQSIRIIERSPS